MAIIRVLKNKKNPYFMMNKTGINDPRLSLKSKGLLAYLISKPDGWYINYQDIIKNSNNGIKSIRSSVKELLRFGYIVRSQIRNIDGKYGFYDYTVYEVPTSFNIKKNSLSPHSPFRHAVKPPAVKRTPLNNDLKNIITTTTTLSGNSQISVKPFVDDSAALEKKNFIIEMFKELNITNYQKIFEEFPIFKIFLYSTWLKNRTSKISNPTGFLISALRENWIDYSLSPVVKKIPRWWVYCFPCRKNYNYQSQKKINYTCPICKKIIPLTKHERF